MKGGQDAECFKGGASLACDCFTNGALAVVGMATNFARPD